MPEIWLKKSFALDASLSLAIDLDLPALVVSFQEKDRSLQCLGLVDVVPTEIVW